MCSDWETKWRHFGLQDNVHPQSYTSQSLTHVFFTHQPLLAGFSMARMALFHMIIQGPGVLLSSEHQCLLQTVVSKRKLEGHSQEVFITEMEEVDIL